jgi:hypothetical protein
MCPCERPRPSMRTPGGKVVRGRWGRSLSGGRLVGVVLGRWRCCTCCCTDADRAPWLLHALLHSPTLPSPELDWVAVAQALGDTALTWANEEMVHRLGIHWT